MLKTIRSCEIMKIIYPFGYGHNNCMVFHIFSSMIQILFFVILLLNADLLMKLD